MNFFLTNDLKHEELISISGGRKSFFYKAGAAWMNTNLMILGTMAGIWEGLIED